jgi:hypothetical protein
MGQRPTPGEALAALFEPGRAISALGGAGIEAKMTEHALAEREAH